MYYWDTHTASYRKIPFYMVNPFQDEGMDDETNPKSEIT